MRKQEVGELCCKVLSIYTLIAGIEIGGGALISLISLHSVARQTIGSIAHVIVFFPSLLLFCLSACFWLYADDISRRMFHDEEESSVISTGSTPETIKQIAFTVAGILILNGAISALVNPIGSVLNARTLADVPRQVTIYSKVYLAEAVIRIVFGTWLILGTDKIRRLPSMLRNLTKKDW